MGIFSWPVFQKQSLQSPFKMEFSMGSLWRSYRRYLWHHRRSLRRLEIVQASMTIVAQLTKQGKTLSNMVKHVKHHEHLWNITKHIKHHEPPVKHHETLIKHCKTPWNTQTLAVQCDNIGPQPSDRHGNIGTARVSADIGVGITPQMCNRVTNPWDMVIFSRPDCGINQHLYFWLQSWNNPVDF